MRTVLTNAIVDAAIAGRKVIVFGNGGLAAEAEHFCAELMGKFGRDIYVRCIALTGPSSLVTALANDFGWESVFKHQVSVWAVPGDVVIGMTTGGSVNVMTACGEGCRKGARVFYLNGATLGIQGGMAIQEAILNLCHLVAYDVKEELYARSQPEQPVAQPVRGD